MQTREVLVQRKSVVSSKSFEEVVDRLTTTISHPNIVAFHNALEAAKTGAELENIVHEAIGDSELMEFARYDSGDVLRKYHGGRGPKILRLVVGNPLIMKKLAEAVPDAASYAPVTILVDERTEGVRLSYDSMASLLSPYGNSIALAVAKELDEKVEKLLETAAA